VEKQKDERIDEKSLTSDSLTQSLKVPCDSRFLIPVKKSQQCVYHPQQKDTRATARGRNGCFFDVKEETQKGDRYKDEKSGAWKRDQASSKSIYGVHCG